MEASAEPVTAADLRTTDRFFYALSSAADHGLLWLALGSVRAARRHDPAFALRLGLALIAPGNVSRGAALMAAAKPATRIMYGAALMFAAAAFVEAFWSPLTSVPFDVKIGVGLAGWVLLLAYFALAGRPRAAG